MIGSRAVEKTWALLAVLSLATLLVTTSMPDCLSADQADQRNWAQWRGPMRSGVAPHADPPVSWSETTGIRWKVRTPGSGTSTPIIWNEKIFIQTAIPVPKTAQPVAKASSPEPSSPAVSAQSQTTAKRMVDRWDTDEDGKVVRSEVPEGIKRQLFERTLQRHGLDPKETHSRKELEQAIAAALDRANRPARRMSGFGGSAPPTDPYQFVLLCIDRQTGKTVWQKVACQEVPHEGHHQDHGYASYSPVTDGKLVFAYFGSRGVHCFDMNGKAVWSKDLGNQRIVAGFGEGSSPTIHDNAVIVNWDHEGDSFIIALDKATGKTLWKVDRDERTSWSTPLVVEYQGETQIVTAAGNRVRGYEVATGKLIWECGGLTSNVIPSPVTGDGMVYATSGFRGNALLAIRLGRTGDLTDTDAVQWRVRRNTPYVPSPLLYGGNLYFFSSNNAVLSCFDAKSGQAHFGPERIADLQGVYASPLGASGRVYLVGRNGVTVVIKLAKELEVLATNRLDDRIDASPAAVDRELFLRGHDHLYCLASD